MEEILRQMEEIRTIQEEKNVLKNNEKLIQEMKEEIEELYREKSRMVDSVLGDAKQESIAQRKKEYEALKDKVEEEKRNIKEKVQTKKAVLMNIIKKQKEECEPKIESNKKYVDLIYLEMRMGALNFDNFDEIIGKDEFYKNAVQEKKVRKNGGLQDLVIDNSDGKIEKKALENVEKSTKSMPQEDIEH